LQGTIIDGAALTFNDGEVIAAHANSGMDLLQRLLSMDEGARRLGEVALVANSSPIAATGCFFFNTLLDENAGSHIALGQSFPNCIVGGDQADQRELLCRGGNSSAIHIDCVIGSSEMYVLGTTEDGRSKTLMEQGEWVS
jgi:aminopeptidase